MSQSLRFMKPLFCFVLILIVYSCSKDGDNGTTNNCSNIIQVQYFSPYANPQWQFFTNVTYDDKGRVSTIKSDYLNYTEYHYFKDRIEMQATDIYGNNIGDTFYLNTSGRVQNTKKFNYRFLYNSDGYITSYQSPVLLNDQAVDYIPYTLEYEDGNLVKVSTPNTNVSNQLVTFTYSSEPYQDMMGYNSPLYLSGVLGDRNTFYLVKAGFFGALPKNLVQTISVPSQYSTPNTLTYQFDSAGRIRQLPGAYQFIYQCH